MICYPAVVDVDDDDDVNVVVDVDVVDDDDVDDVDVDDVIIIYSKQNCKSTRDPFQRSIETKRCLNYQCLHAQVLNLFISPFTKITLG